ncbi:MAG: hypothetical protein ACI4UO_05395, partial [Paludibacteraceae bacterium]
YLDWVLKNCAEPTRQLIEQVRHPKQRRCDGKCNPDLSGVAPTEATIGATGDAGVSPAVKCQGTQASSPAKKNTPPTKRPAGAQMTLEF